MYLSKELYSNVSALKALQAVLKAKGRKVKGLNEQVQNALETLSPEVLANMLMKKVDAKGVNYKLVKEAFPDILP